MRTTSLFLSTALISLALTACSEPVPENDPMPPVQEVDVTGGEETTLDFVMPASTDEEPADAASLADAVAWSGRSDEDVARDAARKPLAVMEYIGVEPGMTILELEAGGGYFTDIFSRAIGPDGKVYMQNPAAFDSFLGTTLDDRLGNERLPNVEYIKSQFDAFPMEDDSVDMVTWIHGPHELWFTPEGSDSLGDPAGAFAEMKRVLKPGGAIVLIDHHAPEDAPATTGGDTHRISEKIIRDLADGAGLTFVSSSDMFINPDDPLTNNVFDPTIRGKTSQFFLVYTK